MKQMLIWAPSCLLLLRASHTALPPDFKLMKIAPLPAVATELLIILNYLFRHKSIGKSKFCCTKCMNGHLIGKLFVRPHVSCLKLVNVFRRNLVLGCTLSVVGRI
jgi:hypothetical protein